jgi:hypothetical protein
LYAIKVMEEVEHSVNYIFGSGRGFYDIGVVSRADYLAVAGEDAEEW